MTQNITAVELSRIAGYAYPSYDVEKERLLLLFSSPQAISLGDVICTSAANSDCESLLLCDETHLRDDYELYYHVKDVTVESNEHAVDCKELSGVATDSYNPKVDANETLQSPVADSRLPRAGDSKVKSVTVTGKTRIVLKGRTNHAVASIMKPSGGGSIRASKINEASPRSNSYAELTVNASENLLEDSIFTLYELYSKILRFTVPNDCKVTENSDFDGSGRRGTTKNCDDLDLNLLTITDNAVFGLINSPLLVESLCGEEG